MPSRTRIESVGHLLGEIANSGLQDKWGSHVRIWFRGHADGTWRLQPNIYRSGIKGSEDDQILVERHLTQDFVSYSARMLSGNESDAEIYFIQQHYRMPTRLLDWSGNPLAALYFAVSSHHDLEGEIFMLDSYGFKGGHKTVRHADYQKAMRCIFDFTYNEWPDQIMAVRPPAHDPRIIAQSGYFTFHPKGRQYLDELSNSTLKSFVIPMAAKATIRRELELMNFNEFTVYGGLDHLANWLKASYSRPHKP